MTMMMKVVKNMISEVTKVFVAMVNDFKPDNNCRNCDVFVVTEVSKLMLPGKWLMIERS